jgi:cell division protein FtsB
MAAVPSPAAPTRAPQVPGSRPSGRPDLRVVGPVRHTSRFALAFGLVTVLAVLGIVALHAMAAEAAFEAQVLEGEVAELSLRQEELSAAIAGLESPDRIRTVATEDLGMVRAEQPGYVVLDDTRLFDGPEGARLADSIERLLANR